VFLIGINRLYIFIVSSSIIINYFYYLYYLREFLITYILVFLLFLILSFKKSKILSFLNLLFIALGLIIILKVFSFKQLGKDVYQTVNNCVKVETCIDVNKYEFKSYLGEEFDNSYYSKELNIMIVDQDLSAVSNFEKSVFFRRLTTFIRNKKVTMLIINSKQRIYASAFSMVINHTKLKLVYNFNNLFKEKWKVLVEIQEENKNKKVKK